MTDIIYISLVVLFLALLLFGIRTLLSIPKTSIYPLIRFHTETRQIIFKKIHSKQTGAPNQVIPLDLMFLKGGSHGKN
jgi:hypothetical protein